MKEHITRETLYARFLAKNPALADVLPAIEAAAAAICDAYRSGGRLFLCGNGGSCADAAHIAGELLKGFLRERPLSADDARAFSAEGALGEVIADKLQGSLAAIDLNAQGAVMSAVANDTDPVLIYAQQLWGLGRPGDVLIGISTSGNAQNVLAAGLVAQRLGMTTVAMTGNGGGKMAARFDIALRVPADWTPEVQEQHIAVYHLLCALIEDTFFPQ